MAPEIGRSEWRVAEERRQEVLKEAARLHLVLAARRDSTGPDNRDRLQAALRSLGPALLHVIANVSQDRPSAGFRGYRDGLL